MSNYSRAIEIRAEFLRETEQLKEKAAYDLKHAFKKAWAKCLENQETTAAYYKFLVVLQSTYIEELIKTKYDGVSPEMPLLEGV